MKKSNNAMNPDDFENQLQRHPIRPAPAEWRAEILATAKAAAPPTQHATRNPPSLLSTFNHHLSTILWPCPQAWAGLAAVWLLILIVNYSTEGKSQMMAKKTSPPSPEIVMALKEQHRLMAKLIEPFDQPLAEPSKPFIPRPRSESQSIITFV